MDLLSCFPFSYFPLSCLSSPPPRKRRKRKFFFSFLKKLLQIPLPFKVPDIFFPISGQMNLLTWEKVTHCAQHWLSWSIFFKSFDLDACKLCFSFILFLIFEYLILVSIEWRINLCFEMISCQSPGYIHELVLTE